MVAEHGHARYATVFDMYVGNRLDYTQTDHLIKTAHSGILSRCVNRRHTVDLTKTEHVSRFVNRMRTVYLIRESIHEFCPDLLRAECRILRADARARSWAHPPVPFLFLLNVFASASRARVEEFRTLPLVSEQRKLSWLQPRSPRPLEFWSQLPGKSVVP